MKKNELKNMIKECVREVLFEDGILSTVIAEVTHGLITAQGLIRETSAPIPKQARKKETNQKVVEQRRQLSETKKKMLDAMGGDSMKNVFEGTKPLAESSTHSPLSGLSADDAGVDISGLTSRSNDIWEKLK